LTLGAWVLAAPRLQRLKLHFGGKLTAAASLETLTTLTTLEVHGWGDWQVDGYDAFAIPPSLLELDITGHQAKSMPQQVCMEA
jgi:hypothetical protein